MFCMKCGTKLPDDAMFCYKCGAKINTNFNSGGASTSVVGETSDSNNTVKEKFTIEEYIELAEKEYQEYLNCKNSDADLIREEAGKHKTQAISFFKSAGVKGEFQLAKHYMEENTPDELTAAMKIFKKLGDEGNAEAFYNLGLCYDSGDNINIEQAKIWLLKADEIGHTEALKTLARLYYREYKKNHEKEDLQNAVKYYGEGVKRKDIAAMLELAKIAKFENGRWGLTIKQCEKLCNDVLSIDKANVKATALLDEIARERQEEQERLERVEREKIEREKREAAAREKQRLEEEQRYRSPEETKKRIEDVVIRTMHGFVFDYIIELGREGRTNTTFYLGDIDSSKLKGAKRSYIKPRSTKEEEVIFLFDNSLMGDGEEGFALTPYGLTSSKFRKCIPYYLIEEVILEGGFIKDIFVKVKNGLKIEFSGISKCESEIVKLLNEIIHNEKCLNDSELLINSIEKDDISRTDILFLNDEETVDSDEIIEEGEDANEQFILGNDYYEQNNYDEAWKCFMTSAKQGNAEAQAKLAWMYYKGYGVTQDYNEAFNWCQKATKKDNAYAQFIMGLMYSEGAGVTKDYNESVKWYRKAAEQGHSSAQNNLGYMYAQGKGVARNTEEAERWYRKAAEQGNSAAETNLKRLKDGCFITTAVCGSLNKPDDCDELMSMRWLRDKLKVEDSDMAALIEEYYRVAPLLVKKIDSKADAPVVYRMLWENSISKIYSDIKHKDYQDAKLRYISMLEDLCARYDEPLASGIKSKIEKVRLYN